MNVTINELAKKTGISSYELRRRVHNGTLPHTRVGTKQTKILIDEDVFAQLLMDESIKNMTFKGNSNSFANNLTGEVGYSRLRHIK
jgi:excisionase family DNA binding protein